MIHTAALARHSALALLLFGATAAAQTEPPARPSTPAPTLAEHDQLVRQLRQVLTPQDAADRARLVKSLRSLKDPSLAPFFTQMSAAQSAALRAESVLALAELDPARGLDLLPVKKFDPTVQFYVLSAAIEAGLVKIEQLEDLARWPDLQPGLYISVASRLAAAQRRVDPVRLRQVLGGNDPIISTVAAILLKQTGQGDSPIALGDKLFAARATGGQSVVEGIRRVLTVVRDRRLSAGVDFARKAIDTAGSDRLLRFDAVSAALAVDPSPERATQLLASELSAASDPAERVRLAVAAAHAAIHREPAIPASFIETLRQNSDESVSQLGEALAAIAARSDSAPAFTRLAQRRSPPITGWILAAAKKLPTESANAARLAVVRSALDGNEQLIEALAADAAEEIATEDPALLLEPLLLAIQRDDSKTAGRIIGAGLKAHNPRSIVLADAGRLAIESGPQPEWPSQGVGAMAAILKARFTERPTAQQVEHLAKVATGSGNLPEVLRMQAAWLALKAATDDRAALARMLAETSAD